MSSAYWQCAKCGTVRVKNAETRRAAEVWIRNGEPVLGHETCERCGNRYSAEEIYRGRTDPPQHDAFIAAVLGDPSRASWNAATGVWTLRESLSRDAVVIFALNAATVAQYRQSASPLQLAAVALAKTSKPPHDLRTDDDGLVVPGDRLQSDFPTWRIWLSEGGELWVTKQRRMYETYDDETIPERLKQAGCAGPVPAIPYLVGLCVNAGLDPNKLSPLELRRLDERAAHGA